ncbi:peptidyl-prolyl cis-trans isomerase SurA [Neolewinella xylanilytica]|uniref:Peptidyl-prolyl cis-trans isomerase SurA n=1 Tax=Neolewinella xylanilytica TaxID=1514080 RepID=A0A2S6I2Q0_9BACT|nr:peptidylprolyl isomerase [Neolewinella xylanilytica]PPK85420.1 peptidyl-prolyl cis-trans isomerase SurA [Neolewinella xylanilytica]
MIKSVIGLLLPVLLAFPLAAQDDSDVLFTVSGEPVTVGEFRYIYSKTNGKEADFSRASVMEYLDLYERFKLKVARAREMGLDTIVALQNELEGYRQQLADNYLLDQEVTDKLVAELYERKQRDVDFSHILINIASLDPADTLAAYERAMEVKKGLTADNFSSRAAEASDDAYSKDQGGHIGFVNAPLPNGMYHLESALYGANDGQVVGPVRTPAGYHLLLKHGTRPAYGEVEAAHILLRKSDETDDAAQRQRAEAARQALRDGRSFEDVAAEYSEDDKTSKQGGYIGFFAINRYNKTFEEAAFSLTEDDQVSEVVESPVGFHILKRISHRGVQPLEEQAPLLEAAVRQDSRFAEARQALFDRLEREYGTRKVDATYSSFVNALDSTFFQLDTDFGSTDRSAALLRVGDREYTTGEFIDYLEANARLRASLERRFEIEGAIENLFESWKDERVEHYAEARLEEQFPEFKALMREYREGILLFEATKLEVWDRAGEDTIGLQAFFDDHRDQYRFAPRARVLKYTINTAEGTDARAVAAAASSQTSAELVNKFGTDGLRIEEQVYEEATLPEGVSFREGTQSPVDQVDRNTAVFYRVVEMLPARQKELSEARGYVIADYQDQLEREWVKSLREKFEVQRNEAVLAKLIES